MTRYITKPIMMIQGSNQKNTELNYFNNPKLIKLLEY